MNVPLLLLLMSLATFRLTRLVIRDTFPPALWLRDRVAGGWRPLTSEEMEYAVSVDDNDVTTHSRLGSVTRIDGRVNRYVRRWKRSPQWLADLWSCAWCASGWVSLALTAAVAFTVGVPVPLLVWPAVWGAGALLASKDWA